jgi:peptide/nickel transport system ATP-binding protein
MFKGKIVERGEVNQVLKKPKHPYTKALLGCVPDALGKKQLTPIDYEKLDRAIQRL